MNPHDITSILCPSTRMKEGVTLLGIVMPDGQVAFAPNRLMVTRDFVSNAVQGRSPEKRFRFADVCVRTACRQWTGSRCGVIDEVLKDGSAEGPSVQAERPECSIRPQCRWYDQARAEACRVCPFVITDCRPEESDEMGATA